MLPTAHDNPMATTAQQPGYAPGFVASVLDDAIAHDSRVYSITGLQGTGKSTIAAQLVALARQRGIRAVALSIDDFYLDRDARVALGREVHPLLATRGVPGTHSPALGQAVIDAVRAGRSPRSARSPAPGSARSSSCSRISWSAFPTSRPTSPPS